MWKRTWMIGSVMAFMLLVAAPVGAGPKGTDRPFWGQATGEVTFAFGPECTTGPIVTTTASGKATHMGRVTAVWNQCAIGSTGGWTGQTATIEAANGDQLFLEGTNPDGADPFWVTIVGGTGRFDGATGLIQASAIVVPEFLPPEVCTPTPLDPCFDPSVPWAWTGTLNGTIDY